MEYQLTEEAKKFEKERYDGRLTWLIVPLLPTLIIIFFLDLKLALLLLLISFLQIYRMHLSFRNRYKSRISLCISLNDDLLSLHRDDKTDIIINRDAIKRIIDIPNEGLRVYSNNYPDEIFIPIGICDFQFLKKILSTWSNPIGPNQGEFKYLVSIIYGTLAIIIVAFFINSRVFWLFVCFLVIGIFIFGFLRDILLKKGLSKFVPILIPILLAIIAFLLSKFIH